MNLPTLLNPRGDYQEIYDQAFRFSRERLYPLLARMDDDDWYPRTSWESWLKRAIWALPHRRN